VLLSFVIYCAVTTEYSLEELARAVRDWCEQHKVYPANGQAAEEITERNIRYYRTLGLLDAPIGGYTKSFTEKHRLQLIAIRLFQAQGLPLRRIRDELYGKSLEDLAALETQAGHLAKGARPLLALATPFQPDAGTESWSVVPLADEFLLVSRRNRQLPRSIIQKINQALSLLHSTNEDTNEDTDETQRN